ncbi:MT-A70-domain-containing protein [Chlamydoabsidia padenii]|nr:MT-A70-domain-containing protein [Chlamydoabsidia padenii]
MSILHSTNAVDIIDCTTAFSILPWYKLQHHDFDLQQPYYRIKSTPDANPRPKKKQRISTTDIQTQERHDDLLPFLLQCMDHTTAYWQQHRTTANQDLQHKNGVQQKDVSPMINFPDWIPMASASRRFHHADKIPIAILDQEQQEFELLDLFNQVIKNESLVCRNIKLGDHGTFIIPPQSDFFMGDLENINDLVMTDNKTNGYDLIVMDPPWPNKSVHRSSHYETQDIYDLYQIPLPSLVHDGSLIAVWITNKPKYRRFVMNKLFKSWHVTCVAEWTWIKVTTGGESVLPMDSTHRKPYEQLIIGRYHQGGNVREGSSELLPYQHAIVSVPSTRHSRKPPLHGNIIMLIHL